MPMIFFGVCVCVCVCECVCVICLIFTFFVFFFFFFFFSLSFVFNIASDNSIFVMKLKAVRVNIAQHYERLGTREHNEWREEEQDKEHREK